jgi:hypothetical protein
MTLEPYYVRVMLPNGKVWLLDHRKKELILMNPAKKTAKIMVTGRELFDMFVDIYDSTRNITNIPGYSIDRNGQTEVTSQEFGVFAVNGRPGRWYVFILHTK